LVRKELGKYKLRLAGEVVQPKKLPCLMNSYIYSMKIDLRILINLFFIATPLFFAHVSHAQWVASTPIGPCGETSSSLTVIASNGQYLFVGTQSGGIFKSSDYGLSWHPCDNGIYFDSVDANYPPITAFTTEGSKVYVSLFPNGPLVYVTSNNGSDWKMEPINGLPESSFVQINALTKCGNYLFAGTSDSGVYVLSDTGSTWEQRNSGLSELWPLLSVTAFAVNDTTIYVGSYGDDGVVGSVFASTNFGKTWSGAGAGGPIIALAFGENTLFIGSTDVTVTTGSITPPITGKPYFSYPVRSIAVIDSSIFLGSSQGHGFFVTTGYVGNGNAPQWTSFNDGLPTNAYGSDYTVSSIMLMDSFIFVSQSEAFTEGPSCQVYRRPLSDFGISSVVQSPATIPSEFKIFPNPFSQSTQITFSSQAAGYAEVSIVNMLGVEVARLFSGELSAGEHSYMWSNPSGLPNGAYECLVRMNGQVETLPVVLMR
jgi:hypothetical protein